MKKTEKTPSFSPYIFWDIDMGKLDYKRDKVFIIERVLCYGAEDDERQLYQFYDEHSIRKIVLHSDNLDIRTASYLSAIFDIPIRRFKCYKNIQSRLDYGIPW
jgi:hypothetical protein